MWNYIVILKVRRNKTAVCWAQGQERIVGDRELLRYKMGTKQKFTHWDTDLYHMECKENTAAILASVAFVLQLHLFKASF